VLRIRDPDPDVLPIPDPGVKKASDPGCRIPNTARNCKRRHFLIVQNYLRQGDESGDGGGGNCYKDDFFLHVHSLCGSKFANLTFRRKDVEKLKINRCRIMEERNGTYNVVQLSKF
jgi:hypothetical protein